MLLSFRTLLKRLPFLRKNLFFFNTKIISSYDACLPEEWIVDVFSLTYCTYLAGKRLL
jgi:hypothetical protein